MLGFIRWVVLIPYLAQALQNPPAGVDAATIVFLEGFANHYLGMTVGEHLGFLAQAIWMTLLAVVMLRTKLFHRSLGWVTLAFGLAAFPMSLEPLNPIFAIFAPLSLPINGGWLIVLFVMAYSLLRTDVRTGEGVRLGWKTAVTTAIVFALAVLPGMIG